jgi:DNA-binding winged helix-turn-helix (wHTH) protein
MTMRVVLANGPLLLPDAIVVDHDSRCIWHGRKRYPSRSHGLVRFRLLAALVVNITHTLTYQDLIQHVWPGEWPSVTHKARLSVMLSQERDRLSQFGITVETVWGRGLSISFAEAAAS